MPEMQYVIKGREELEEFLEIIENDPGVSFVEATRPFGALPGKNSGNIIVRIRIDPNLIAQETLMRLAEFGLGR